MRELKLFITYLGLIISTPALSQNLIPNPSFEQLDEEVEHYLDEPGWVMGGDHIIKHWFKISQLGPHYVSTKNGTEAHSGEIAIRFTLFNKLTRYAYEKSQRDYIAVKLKTPLEADRKYKVTFYIKEKEGNFYAVGGIGIAFIKDLIQYPTDGVIELIPYFEHPGILHSSSGKWILVEGIINAEGGEKYLVLGSFRSNSDTKRKKVGTNKDLKVAEYYIDDVSLILLGS